MSDSEKISSSGQSNKVLDGVIWAKIPFALVLLVAYGSYIFVQHRRAEADAHAELGKLNAQLMAATSMRQETLKVHGRLVGMLKDIKDFRQILQQDEKLLANSKTTISGMDAKTELITKQVNSCPEEISTSVKQLQAIIVRPEPIGQPELDNGVLKFEQKYMPLMWKAVQELKERIHTAAPEDVSNLRQQVNTLRQLLSDATAKIGKVDKDEFEERQARMSELEAEIQRLGGEVATNLPTALHQVSEMQMFSKRTHKHKTYAKATNQMQVKGEPMKCLKQ